MKFVIWAPSFNDLIGGRIVLHLLCHRLNEIGETAMVWPDYRPRLTRGFTLRELLRRIRWEVGRIKRPRYDRSPFNNPIARERDLKDAIVVYPEIIEGNPLRASSVVRWLLHKPGFHTGRADFGTNELVFHYQPAFQDPAYPSERLTVSWTNETYRDLGLPGRSGSAYILRKGKDRQIVHDLNGSVCVDDMSHAERAAVFNQVEYCFIYDLFTMYARYAAICGCIPVIIPDPALPKETWAPTEEGRYGLAYGLEEVPWARETRGKLLEQLNREEEDEAITLRRFIRICRERFS